MPGLIDTRGICEHCGGRDSIFAFRSGLYPGETWWLCEDCYTDAETEHDAIISDTLVGSLDDPEMEGGSDE